jgi:hypothetical protein
MFSYWRLCILLPLKLSTKAIQDNFVRAFLGRQLLFYFISPFLIFLNETTPYDTPSTQNLEHRIWLLHRYSASIYKKKIHKMKHLVIHSIHILRQTQTCRIHREKKNSTNFILAYISFKNVDQIHLQNIYSQNAYSRKACFTKRILTQRTYTHKTYTHAAYTVTKRILYRTYTEHIFPDFLSLVF